MEADKVQEIINDDKNKIKKPQNAYFLYCQVQRPLLKAQYPDKLLKDINKILGDQWKNLTLDEQNIYKSQATIEHQQFKELYPEYHYEKMRPKKINTTQINTDPLYQCNLDDFVTDKYTIDQIRNFLKPGETTLNFQYTDDFTRP